MGSPRPHLCGDKLGVRRVLRRGGVGGQHTGSRVTPSLCSGSAEVPPLSQDVLFHFPPAPSAAPVPAVSQGARNGLFLLFLPQVLP